MKRSRILVVDDEPQIRRVMRTTLAAEGYDVVEARDGESALERLRAADYDLVLLDLNMPGISGLETCRAMRARSDTAIVVLTVRDSEGDKIEALDAGADDYVTKPFSTQELLARLRAALRRSPLPLRSESQRMTVGNREIDFRVREITAGRKKIRLTPKEVDLLRYFAAHPGQALSHRELLSSVWGSNHADRIEYLRVFVNQLRRKMSLVPTLLGIWSRKPP
jgi:two-component system, OmpR family, KDP operon response regulator KdpE